ncbi:MAG: NAD(P)-dependent oxidoreductase [Acidimicrobiales bacterium]
MTASNTPKVAVASRLFNLLPQLKEELLAAYPEAKIATKSVAAEDDLIEFLTGYDVAVIGIERFTERVLENLPDLKVVACCSAGVDHLDPALLKKHNVAMGWIPGVNKHAVSELAIGLMLDVVRNVNWANVQLRAGNWAAPPRGRLLRGATVGVHGCGNIGKETVKLLQPFGVEILACDREDYPEFYEQYNVTAVSPEELWERSEVLTIHLPRNSTTIGMYTAEVLDQLRPGMFLINTARGSIVDEDAVAERLADGRIAGAAFDVFHIEPVDSPELIASPDFIGLPHMGASAREAWLAMGQAGMQGITENAVPEPGVYPFD